MNMKKLTPLIMMACVVLATPALAPWIYEGTDVWISEPTSDYDPNGTWWYSWDGEGNVDGDPFYLDAYGWTMGECGVALEPISGDPLYQGASVGSHVRGRSSYRWEPGGSRDIEAMVTVEIDPGTGISYEGQAIDDTHVSVVHSTSAAGAYNWGGCSDPELGYYSAQGGGQGYAITQSGSGADNDWDNVTVSTDYTDSWYPPPYLYNQGYEGLLEFTTYHEELRQGTPSEDAFEIEAEVNGSCISFVGITINDPNYFYLKGRAEAAYYISGLTSVDLDGDIE
jgi:hypothetical protein